jgi:multidrug efflux system membrane fusion protein
VFSRTSEQPVAAGRLSFVDSSVDPKTGTIPVKAILPNDDGALWPGQYVKVEVELGVLRDVVTVPLVALQTGPAGQHVFVLKPQGAVEVRPVDPGELRGDQVQISKGLRAGEAVVVEGQKRLVDGTRVTERVRVSSPVGPARAVDASVGARR